MEHIIANVVGKINWNILNLTFENIVDIFVVLKAKPFLSYSHIFNSDVNNMYQVFVKSYAHCLAIFLLHITYFFIFSLVHIWIAFVIKIYFPSTLNSEVMVITSV